jgi:integrase
MATVRLYPEKRKNESGVLRVRNVPLLLFFHYNGKRMQMYTGERIHLSDWDAVNERVLPSNPAHQELNAYLEMLSNRVLRIYREHKITGSEPGIKELRSLVKESLKKSKGGFFDSLIRFIEENHSSWTLATYRKVKTIYNHLHLFSERTGTIIEFDRIDKSFLDKLSGYFSHECGHADSTVRKNLEVMFWFLHWAEKKGLCKNRAWGSYLQNELPVVSAGPGTLHLLLDELKKLSSMDILNSREAFARDVFCLVCYTGLSIHELRALRPEQVHGNSIWVETRRKARSIPLNEQSSAILGRYLPMAEQTVFNKLYGQKINHTIKILGARAGLNRSISKLLSKKGQKEETIQPLFQCLTLSLAHKTFLYLALDLGLNEIALLDIAGYKQLKTIQGYKLKFGEFKASEMKKFNKS